MWREMRQKKINTGKVITLRRLRGMEQNVRNYPLVHVNMTGF